MHLALLGNNLRTSEAGIFYFGVIYYILCYFYAHQFLQCLNEVVCKTAVATDLTKSFIWLYAVLEMPSTQTQDAESSPRNVWNYS